LPGVAASAIDRLVEVAVLALRDEPDKPLVALVPDRHGTGTNALLVAPPSAIPSVSARGVEPPMRPPPSRPAHRTWN